MGFPAQLREQGLLNGKGLGAHSATSRVKRRVKTPDPTYWVNFLTFHTNEPGGNNGGFSQPSKESPGGGPHPNFVGRFRGFRQEWGRASTLKGIKLLFRAAKWGEQFAPGLGESLGPRLEEPRAQNVYKPGRKKRKKPGFNPLTGIVRKAPRDHRSKRWFVWGSALPSPYRHGFLGNVGEWGSCVFP